MESGQVIVRKNHSHCWLGNSSNYRHHNHQLVEKNLQSQSEHSNGNKFQENDAPGSKNLTPEVVSTTEALSNEPKGKDN
jgi:hypothetical protein